MAKQNISKREQRKRADQKLKKSIKEHKKRVTQKQQVMDLFFENNNKPLHYKEIADKTGIIIHNVRRLTGQNVTGKTDKPVFERTSPGTYKLLTSFEGAGNLGSVSKRKTTPKKNQEKVDGSLNELFYEFAITYNTIEGSTERDRSISIMDTLVNKLGQYAPPEYKVKKGVGGGGGWKPAVIPWIGFRDPEVAQSFTRGVYIFYSLSENKNLIYLSVGQGTNRIIKEFGRAVAINQFINNVSAVQKILQTRIKEEKYLKKIDLKSQQQNAIDYEKTVFLAKKYVVNKLPSDEILIEDLKKIIKIYPEIVNSIDNFTESLKIKNKTQEPNSEDHPDSSGIEPLPAKSRLHLTETLVSDPKVVKWIKDLYKGECQICKNIINTPKGNYSEAAHIKAKRDKGVDHEENVLSLCPNCHKQFDKGAIWLNDNLDVIHYKDGKIGKLTINSLHTLNLDNIKFHREKFSTSK